MKLHDLVVDPTKLKTYNKYISPKDAYNRILAGDKDLQLVNAIARDSYYAYLYARDMIKGKWPEGEPAIANNPHYASLYAHDVIKGRFPEGEPAIASDPWYAYIYARDIIKGKWPEGEPAIAKDSYYSHFYTKLIS